MHVALYYDSQRLVPSIVLVMICLSNELVMNIPAKRPWPVSVIEYPIVFVFLRLVKRVPSTGMMSCFQARFCSVLLSADFVCLEPITSSVDLCVCCLC